ncbi:MAG: hypothetical protein JO269_13500 [Burkholderiaceae bacterium]|nr:hypothetical protein [Burkholderiaceae bacterium]
MPIRFNVFGMFVIVERHGNDWRVYYGSDNGVKRPADFVIPNDIEENQLGLYLADLFHEHARPNNSEVMRLDHA